MNIHFPLSYLSEFLQEYPLYSKFGVNQPLEVPDLIGLQFNFFCHNEREYHFFTLSQASSGNGNHTPHTDHDTASREYLPDRTKIDFTEMFTGICQSCGTYKINMTICGGSQKEAPRYFVQKVGQYPAPESNGTKIPKEIINFFKGESRELYIKGLKNLEMGYGAGAFAYFRKVAEAEIGKIIETVSNPYSHNSTRIADAFTAYNHDGQKSKLIEDITPLLPESLKQHGANALLVLHDVAATPGGQLTEEEYIKKSKDIDMLFRYLAKKINGKKMAISRLH